MRDVFTQGSIVANIRSVRYPNIKCKGVVISARCDFAQRKIKYFHCLSAMAIDEWIYEVLFGFILEETKKEVLGKIRNLVKDKSLDFDTLLQFGPDKSITVLEENLSQKQLGEGVRCCNEWKRYEEMESGAVTIAEKKRFFKDGPNKKKLKEKLRNLYNGAFPKYCFVPQKAYSDEGSVTKGIVIDLQDIYQYSMDYVNPIIFNEVDYQLVKDTSGREKFNEFFFFEKEDDFVIVEGIIESPLVEYVLQSFSNAFGRIGVENATQVQIEDFVEKFFEEGE